jgi:hypothetical protein
MQEDEKKHKEGKELEARMVKGQGEDYLSRFGGRWRYWQSKYL